MDLGIAGRTALVTGADSGIGWCTAKLLLEEGARVAVTDVDADRLRAAAADLPGEVVAVAADLTVAEDVQRLHREVTAAAGDPDVLVHAAGITGAQGLFHEVDEEGWRSTFETDFFAAVRVVRAFLPAMRSRGWGRVVLLASEDAVQPYPDELPYCAAKAAVRTFAKGLSKTYGSEGVLVNTVSPAFIETPMTDAMMTKRADEEGTDFDGAVAGFLREERPFITAGRRGRADEVAAVVAFLASERASFVNGSDYRVDSGSVATV
ncbi:SDR family NAD(P)-dependent oxidoreductase [Kineococcus terrestris]|uniref:SDR family NAD(P)-dependent oxidoreductase n=1 Tax=Kineococcus terrestris TaxID=2044856 RepID=UPI0034DAF824